MIRRLSLDLKGLPASPEEVDAFVKDQSPGAVERVVDPLIESPHFGERWARLWLDQARYADSNGYNIDAPRSIWKYRDWVIAAINSGMPFDQFATLQLAGDLVSGDDFGPRIATGFHRNTLINQEGGIDVEQFRVDSIVDRVNTTGTVFLGLTVGCAQCHDHKYDPISQREYYQLYAFFNNVDEPELEIATPRELDARRKVRGEIDKLHRDLAKKFPDLDEREQRWEKTLTLEFTQAQDADVRLAFDSPREKRSKSQRRALVELMIAREPDFQAENQRLSKLRAAEPKFVATMVVSEHKGSPRPAHIHLGGDFTRKGDRVEPGVPRVLPRLSRREPGHACRSAGSGALAGRSAEPARGAGGRQPDLAGLLRAGPGGDGQRFRDAGIIPESSGAARLACLRADGFGLEREADPPADRELGDVSAGIAAS